ncbi:NB-ARC domains-containing protein [Tanacetum coccineum]
MNNNITKLPDYELLLPHLEVFLISYNYELPMFSDELVQSMKKVKVFDMGYCNQSALLGFQPLTKLRVLNLKDNRNVVDISIFGEMKDLEILILSGTRIKKIPQEIGRLVNLRRLDVLGCRHLNHVADGVISKLSRLEELRIPFTPIYGTPLPDGEIYDRIVEVMNLKKLTYLDLYVKRFDVIPEGLNFRKHERFEILLEMLVHFGCKFKEMK